MWAFCTWEISLLSFAYLQLFISVQTQRYLFYTWLYNPILLYFIAQMVLALTTGGSFSSFLYPFDTPLSRRIFVF